MKRELKFRVFQDNQMIYQTGALIDLARFFRIVEYANPEYLNVMQFTGLADKNGKEIYEGDVIEYDGELMGQIEFSEGCYYAIGVDTIQASEFNKSCIVIGNIYETPELINN